MKKNLWIAGIFVVGLMMIVGIIRYIEVQKRENDSNWQIAKEIYKVENALKEVDADYECQSVAKVTPFPYTDSEGNTIVYYCIQTVYLENESGGYTGLDMNAISMVVDMTHIDNKREVMVNKYDALLCEIGNVFGCVKEQKIAQTKRAFFMDAVVFQLKGLRQTAPCIVLSAKKSLKICDVEQAFNRKRYSFVVIPYRAENVKMIKDAYFDVMNTELEIK